jgi:hypothetical protein
VSERGALKIYFAGTGASEMRKLADLPRAG